MKNPDTRVFFVIMAMIIGAFSWLMWQYDRDHHILPQPKAPKGGSIKPFYEAYWYKTSQQKQTSKDVEQ